MNICQINSVYGFGSTGRSCKEFSEYVNKYTKHNCYTYFSFGKEDAFSFMFGNAFERKIHSLLSRIFCNQGGYSFLSTLRLVKSIKRHNIDVCIIRNIHSNNINLNILFNFLKKENIKTFLYLDDCWFYTAKCMHYTAVGCEKWKSVCYKCPKLRDDNPSWFFDFTKQNFLRKKELFANFKNLKIIGVSKWITNEAMESSIFKNNLKFYTIYNWIDTNVFSPKSLKNTSNKKIIISVATFWSDKKGLNKIVEISNYLPNDFEIWLVGKHDKKFQNTDRLKFLGEITDKMELAKIYGTAYCYLNMSIEESFGKVSAEALSCGVPVVCFNSTANPEIVCDDCGIILEKKCNVDQIIKSIISLNTNESLRSKCREYALKHFNTDLCIKNFIKIIND